jgi:hypothetical protein
MSVPRTNNYVTGGTTDYGWYSVGRKSGMIRERVNVAGNLNSATLSQQLPPGAKIIWGSIKHATATTPYLSSIATNTAVGLIALVGTAPSSLGTGATTSNFLVGPAVTSTVNTTPIPINSVKRDIAPANTTFGGVTATTQLVNNSTSAMSLYLIPYASSTGATDSTSRYFSSTGTAGYTFNGTATTVVSFDVQIHFEQYFDPADR